MMVNPQEILTLMDQTFAIALMHKKAGDVDLALKQLDKILELQPQKPDPSIYTINEEFQAIIKIYVQAIIERTAILLLNYNEYQQALTSFEKLLKEFPNANFKADFWFKKSLAHQGLHDHQNQLLCLNKSVAINPTDQKVLIVKAELLINMEKYQEGFRLLKRAIELEENPELLTQRKQALFQRMSKKAWLFAQKNINADIVNCYQLILELTDDDSNASIIFYKKIALNNLGLCFQKQERYSQALEYYEQALKLKRNIEMDKNLIDHVLLQRKFILDILNRSSTQNLKGIGVLKRPGLLTSIETLQSNANDDEHQHKKRMRKS